MTLESPVEQRSGAGRTVHWCCVKQTGVPYFGLCGELPVSQRHGGEINCARCLELAHEHVKECARCRPFAARYLR